MLTPEEALLMKAAYDEKDRQQAQGTAGMLGALGGATIGAAGGAVIHPFGKALGSLRGTNHRMKPGFRAAGGLTGAIMGGALGAGIASIMKSESPAARVMSKIQSGEVLTDYDKIQLQNELAYIYSNPSKLEM